MQQFVSAEKNNFSSFENKEAVGSWIEIQDRSLFQITGKENYIGGSQEWYKESWQRDAGCGPTNASHLIWYLSRSRENCEKLTEFVRMSSGKTHERFGKEVSLWQQEDFLQIMEELWKWVTPGKMGVNTTEKLVDGVLAFGKDRGMRLKCNILDVPARPMPRPKAEKVEAFMISALERDLPVAFLNLSNGRLTNLDAWHWVTLIGYERDTGKAVMLDQGKEHEIDLILWLRTSRMGGGFVTVEPDAAGPTM